MCIAGLNVNQTCSHRWYELLRPCDPENNLQNCPEKLRLEGWERQREDCPFCDGTGHHHSTHRLFGSTSSASSVTSSPIIAGMTFNDKHSRRGSGATLTGTMSPLSRETSNSSIECERAIRARDMNDRIHLYLSSDPHEILPSATKNYPTYAAAIAKAENAACDKRARRHNSIATVSRGWQRVSKRFTINSDLFKIV